MKKKKAPMRPIVKLITYWNTKRKTIAAKFSSLLVAMNKASYIVHLEAKSLPDFQAAQKALRTSWTPTVDQMLTSCLAWERASSRRWRMRATSVLAISTLSKARVQFSSQAPNQPRAL
eukprot:CAMPEP_0115309124 /NCGR_PEP_ID=MMETSP0270-20121206/74076_1 /TAXON_ID=71861 /ORGANISM="Scrippsiella trochoidea, Strain CCMP3099" /LENGTH=117 /DNA_ID=CAMNT_0002727751 /DNA_START=131 /DNA_END=484 /DNA_ORIENTATION=-